MSKHAICVAALAAFCGSAMAQVPWNAGDGPNKLGPSGTGSFFSWDNGRSDNGLFGSPELLNGSTFLFNPIGFTATAQDGSSQSTSDTLRVDLFADAGFFFSQIRFVQVGTYIAQNGGEASLSSSLNVLDNTLSPAGRSSSGNMVFTPGDLFTSVAGQTNSGVYNGSVLATLGTQVDPWTSISIEFAANLITVTTDAGQSASLTIGVTGSQIAIQVIPAPATLALAGVGLLAAGRRRR